MPAYCLSFHGVAWLVLLFAGVVTTGCAPATLQPMLYGPDGGADWALVFRDEFEQNRLDTTKWNPRDPWESERNNELQAYVPDAFIVQDGILRIRGDRGQANYGGEPREYVSGMMTTYRKFSQKYGLFEMRARFPEGVGLWPAFWLLPEPLSWPPEIDVLEFLGHQPNTAYFTHHWRASDGQRQSDGGKIEGPDFTKKFHVFSVEWRPDALIWRVNGSEVFRSEKSVPTVRPMYMLANLAIGGDWPGPPDEKTRFPADFEIDYIRVYENIQPASGK